MADDFGREAIPGVAAASGCRHPTRLLTPPRQRKPARRANLTVSPWQPTRSFVWAARLPSSWCSRRREGHRGRRGEGIAPRRRHPTSARRRLHRPEDDWSFCPAVVVGDTRKSDPGSSRFPCSGSGWAAARPPLAHARCAFLWCLSQRWQGLGGFAATVAPAATAP